jgi:hypothetical protein
VWMVVGTDFTIIDSSSFMIFGTPFDENSPVTIILKSASDSMPNPPISIQS